MLVAIGVNGNGNHLAVKNQRAKSTHKFMQINFSWNGKNKTENIPGAVVIPQVRHVGKNQRICSTCKLRGLEWNKCLLNPAIAKAKAKNVDGKCRHSAFTAFACRPRITATLFHHFVPYLLYGIRLCNCLTSFVFFSSVRFQLTPGFFYRRWNAFNVVAANGRAM